LRLGPDSTLPENVAQPGYDRRAQRTGIVHFGIGAFHRAHQAVYTDDAMNAGDTDWGIAGVSLRSGDVAEQMNPQDGLYTVTERSAAGDKLRLIGAVQKVIAAATNRDAVIAAIASADTHIVSFTITEKGYGRAADGSLDREFANDRSVYAYLAAGMQARCKANLPGLTLLSCDNLTNNGLQLRRLMREYLNQHTPELTGWFDAECTCPSAMVDRIVPATTEADRDAVAEILGVRDEAAVFTEPFSQWVIEDRFAGPRPRWEVGGATFVSDVQPYEVAKLRMLNGAHSALAYLGLARGYEFVHQAMADAELASLVGQLMRDEAATSFEAAAGQDLDAYADALVARFRNPALNHRLSQIAMDGSQKIPQRWLQTLSDQQKRGKQCPALIEALSAWMMHVRGDTHVVDDPMRDVLNAQWQEAGNTGISQALFGYDGLFSQYWQAASADVAMIETHIGVAQ
jgi:fructuronate reductase